MKGVLQGDGDLKGPHDWRSPSASICGRVTEQTPVYALVAGNVGDEYTY